MSGFTTLPIQIFNWAGRPQEELRELAAAAIIVLLAMLLLMNAVAIIIRNRYQKRW
jgi:ABC-type phosphate transport system permease subunit